MQHPWGAAPSGGGGRRKAGGRRAGSHQERGRAVPPTGNTKNRGMGRRSNSGKGTPAQQRAQVALAAAGPATAALTVRSAKPLATLWAGYGTITEVETEDEEGPQQLIVKEVQPPSGSGISHERKLRSYQIEASFYQRVAPHLPAGTACNLPCCLGVHSTLDADGSGSGGGSGGSGSGGMQLVMSDLRQQFPSSCGTLDEEHARAALSWLAAFHAACWGADPEQLGLWQDGCYWHLQTRLDELSDIGREWRQLRDAAHELDRRLAATPFRTLCHGDFKTANLLFGRSGGRLQCAAYDFQYVGGGSGMKDVVYLLATGVQARLLQQPAGEEALLRHYHTELLAGLQAAAAAGGEGGSGSGGVGSPAAAAAALEQYSYDAMLADYRLAMCDYVRWMAGWGFWGSACSWATNKTRVYLQELGLGGA